MVRYLARDRGESMLQDIEIRFQAGCWLSVAEVKRPFVKYSNPMVSPGDFWHYSPDNTQPELSIIIPTSDAHRGDTF